MNLIDWMNAEMQVKQKLREWESYVEYHVYSKGFDEPRLSGRRRLAQLLVGLV